MRRVWEDMYMFAAFKSHAANTKMNRRVGGPILLGSGGISFFYFWLFTTVKKKY